jgi:hypothetical protein
MLRQISNPYLQALLDQTVALLRTELIHVCPEFGQQISLDTKHIIAWVKENNPKAYLKGGRFHKDQPPTGDPDCRLGCKRKRNHRTQSEAAATPLRDAVPGLADEDALATDVGGVYTVSCHNPETQDLTWRIPGVSGDNFPVRAGNPYIVCLDETAPSIWP